MNQRSESGNVGDSGGKNAAGYSVLIVDDNRELLQLLADALEKLGRFRVESAEDGMEGLERYFAMRPDCMVIDIMMPGLDGYQLVKALRGDPDSARTPLIFLTALGQERDRFAGFVAGIDQYLVKPVKPRELVAAVQQALGISDEERNQRQRALLEQEIAKG
jgi:DNA-binding response OmpR family regulator